jgi:DNA-directed RNA polymerase II subunit RPB1
MSSIYKELSFENDTELINGIQFTVMSPDEIRRTSVAEIVSTDTFSGNEPVIGGLFDNRMGVIEHNKICKTCEQKNTFCPGHFGHIELAKPLFYIQFFDMVRKILKCVCWRCSKLLVDVSNYEVQSIVNKKISRQKKFELIYKMCSKIKRCGQENVDGCGAKLPNKITKEKIGKICMEWKENNEDEIKKQLFNADEILMILKGITNEDAELMGMGKDYNRPEWLICTVFPVPPPSVRPSVRNDTGQRCEDDLTHKLCDIVKTNNMLKQKIEKNATKEQMEYWAILLQYHISTFVDNQLPGVAPAKQRTGRPLRSLTERLKSKEGRIRGNLMGKRVDFSARSVITPDPGISIDELGVPIKIAMNITFPEVVNLYNRKKMLQLIQNGPDVYPGAKYIRKHKENYRTIRLKNIDTTMIELLNGDIVDRHLQNGDYVLFNRQPSLHKMSMMAHKVRVMPYDTFRLNVCVTPSYNADYDGDEMNMHVPQSLQTENELIQLAAVPTQIISPRDAKPIISIVQDIALGVYRITHDHVMLSQKHFFNILCNTSKFSGTFESSKFKDEYGTPRWSGKQLISTIIPPNVNIKVGNKSFDPADKEYPYDDKNYVRIENGNLNQGILDKKIYQDMTNGLIHTVYNENGPTECINVFDNTQKMICDWLVYDGFSVGISDLLIDDTTSDRLKEVTSNLKTDVYSEIRKIHQGEFENNSIKTNADAFEDIVNNLLNEATQKIGKIGMDNIDDDNRMLNMIKSGSKGNTINLVQMVGCLGQQSVEGKRINFGFENRTLPHFTKYDDGPESRGFVESSFVKGLTPQEFFFHAMGGREGLIDTAVKTSETGYIQRKLVKAMEDCKINFDMSVRNASGNIIQFLYGEDGMNSIKLENHKICYIDYDVKKMEKEYLITHGDMLENLLDKMTTAEFYGTKDWSEKMYVYYHMVCRDKEYFVEKMFKGKMESKVVYPIAFQRLITYVVSVYDLANVKTPSDLNPLYVLKTIEKLKEDLNVNRAKDGKKLLGMLLRCFLNPKALIMKYNMTKDAFDYIVQKIKIKFYDAIAPPSEMVGVVAAQSIGEPCTQLTLNTFHLSGVASASKAVRGVPRIKELLSVSKNMKAPSCIIYMKKELSGEFEKAQHLLNTIEITHIKDIIKTSDIYFEPNIGVTTVGNDNEFLKFYKAFEEIDNDCDTKASPWVLRMELDKMKMLNLELQTFDIHHSIYNFYEDTISCVFSDDNSDNIVFRIKLNDPNIEDAITELKALEYNIMQTIVIKGIQGIKKVSPRKNDFLEFNKETGVFNKEKTIEWILDTDGTNLLDILSNPMVDATRTLSNDVNEIYNIFGIEAARECLLNEINEVLNDSTSVNYRHIALLVDTMTSKGYMLSIDRHGINRSDIGPLAKCSFEETSDMLIKAGIFSEYDKVNGVSANIMMGQIPPCGTGDTQILVDEEKLLAMEEYTDDEEDDYGVKFTNNELINDECILDNMQFTHSLNIEEL